MSYAIRNLIQAREIQFLERRFPALQGLRPGTFSEVPKDVLAFYFAFIESMHPDAREVAHRNRLHGLKAKTQHPEVLRHLNREIAKSNLREQIPDRAKVLLDDPDLAAEQRRQTQASDNAYGAPLIATNWPAPSRGKSLVWLFATRLDDLKHKRILHVAPEAELETWFREHRDQLAGYQTLDGFQENVDIQDDITCLERIPDNTYDLIICHRVLEHVLDENSAMSSLYRVLDAGGTLNCSVPQSMHSPQTKDWVIPDQTHDFHVRHYGADFSDKLAGKGFRVHLVDTLLSLPVAELLSKQCLPMRIYDAVKPA